MSFRPLFGQITILSLSFVTFRVSRFHVSHLTHETFKLRLQNTLNMSKTTRVYFGVLHGWTLLLFQSLKECRDWVAFHEEESYDLPVFVVYPVDVVSAW